MTDSAEPVEAILEDEGHLTVKAFSREYRETRALGYSLTGNAFSHEEVREALIDLLDKLSWIADAADVRLPEASRNPDQEDYYASGFNEGLDTYQKIIMETKKGLEDLA